MYPNHNPNPFTIGDEDGEFVDEAIVSPLSPTRQRTDWPSNNTWMPSPRAYESEVQRYPSYATEKIEEPSDSVHFNRVNWQAPQSPQNQDHPRSTLSSAEEFRLPRSRDEEDGLGIHVTDDARELKEKKSWEPTQPPPSAYRPNTAADFEDVELNLQKPHEKPDSAKSKKKGRACTENKLRICLWTLVLILPFVVLPVAIFGGVYHWGDKQGLCKAGGGTWESASDECQY